MLAMTEECTRSREPSSPVAPVLPAHLRRRAARRSARTYTRRRIVAAVALTVLVLVAWAALREIGTVGALVAPEHAGPMIPVSAKTYVVQPGETFWSIAHRLDPDGDPRPVVDGLVAAHGSPHLRAGDVIALPATTNH